MKACLTVLWLSLGCGLVLLAQQPGRGPATPSRAKGGGAVVQKTAVVDGGAVGGEVSEVTLGLRFGPSRPLRSPADEETVLPAGLRIFVSENREIPIVNIYALVPGGSAADPSGKAGLAEATAQVVRRGGSASLAARDLDERLNQLGALFESAVTESSAQFTLRLPSQSVAAALALLADLLAAPRLDPEAVDSVLGQMHEAIGQRFQNPAAGLTRLFRGRLYDANSPGGRLPDYDALDSIARVDIERFYRQNYGPGRAVVAIEGDVAMAEVKAKAQELFGAWTAPAVPAPAVIAEPSAPATGALMFVDREELRQSGLIVGHRGGRISDTDFAAMQILCEVLTGLPDGRLPSRVRATGGWRADWSAAWDAGLVRAGEFAVRATVDSAYTTQAVGFIKEELAKLRQSGVTEQELERARTRLLATLAVRYQSSAEQARERAVSRFHGLAPDLLARTYQTLANLTVADVARAAGRNLLPEQVVAVAGNSKLFDKPLATLGGKVDLVEMPIQSARPLNSRSDATSLENGRLALVRMQEALGGAAKLEGIRNSSIRSEGVSLMGERMSSVKLWDRWVQGDVYRQDQEFGPIHRAVFYDGKIAWMGVRGVVAPMPSSMVPVVRSEMFRLLFRLALSDKAPKRQVSDLGGGVLQITEGDAQGVRIYVDPGTGLPQRMVYRLDLGNGLSISAEESFSDWKEFDGIKWPTKIVSKKNGRRSDELTVVEAKFNGAVKVADLEKKP